MEEIFKQIKIYLRENIPDILRENPLAFFETEETNHPRIQCNMPMVDINMIINDLSLSVKRALNTHCNVRLSG